MKPCCCCKSPYFIFQGPSWSKMRSLCGCEGLKREDLSTKTIQQWCGWINIEVYSLAGGLLGPSLSVEHCRVCVSAYVCVCMCVFTQMLPPPTTEGYIMSSLRARWRVQHGGWLWQHHRWEEILLSAPKRTNSNFLTMEMFVNHQSQ